MPISNKEIEKNILDLKFQQKLQEINAYYIAITTGVFGFFGTFIWFPEKIFQGVFISFGVILLFFILIDQTKNELQKTLQNLEKLKTKNKFGHP